MIKKIILLIILLCLIGFETKANTANCPDSVRYNSTTEQFTFYYSGGIPKKGGKSEYTYLGLDITSGKGSGSTHYVKVLTYNSNTLITDNNGGTLDQTSAILYSDNPDNHSREIEYLNNSKNEIGIIHCYYNAVLPVKLIYFGYNNNIFTWKTASELNNKWFILQSSQDGKIWNNEEYIYSKGNSNQIVDYSLIFKPIYPYYRLVQEDWDGKFEIFSSIHINLNIPEERIFDLQLNELSNNISLKPGTIYLSLKNNKWTKIMK